MGNTWRERVRVRTHRMAWAVGLLCPGSVPTGVSSSRHAHHALAHPLWWLTLLVMLLNDHVLRGGGVLPGVLTGKLSHVAGLLFVLALVASLARARNRHPVLLCHAVVGPVFAVINLLPEAAGAWSAALARVGIPWAVWLDSTGLLALPALGASWLSFFCSRSIPRPALPRPLLASALVLGSIACLGCSPWPVAKPTIINSRVFVEHHEGAIFVLDATSGAVRTALVSTGANASAPAIADHILYAVDERNRLTGIDVDNPMLPFVLWQPSDHNARLSVHHVDRHRVYAFVRSDERSLMAIDRGFGQVIWTLPIETDWLPEIRAAGDLLLVSDEQALLAVDARSGTVVWRFQATAEVGTPDVDGQIVYVADSDGVYSGLDVRTGTPVWRFVSGEATCGQSSPMALVDRGVLVGCFDGELHGIAIATSSVTWTASGKLGAYEEGIVVARTDDNQLIGLDGPTGRELWRTELDDDLCTDPAIAAGTAFVRNHVGKIYAVELRTGALRWQVDMGEKVDARVVGDKLLVVRRRL